jgi:glycosyltransferase involved in cell wall biosynthesis
MPMMSITGQPAPRVSVVIPTYNRRALLCEAIKSVLAQTYRNLEVVIVDDGSTDGTGEAIRRLFGNHPEIRYFYKKNGGAASAQNEGIRRARGEFIGLLGDDDLWYPDKLKRQIERLDANPGAELCFSDMLITGGGDDGRRFFEIEKFGGVVSVDNLIQRNFIPAGTVLMRKSCLEAVGLFDESLPLVEDFDLWIRIVATHPVVYVDRVLSVYRRLDCPQLCDQLSILHECKARVLRKNRDLILSSGTSGNHLARRRRLLEREIRHNLAIHCGWKLKELLSSLPTPALHEVVPTLIRAINEEPLRLKHYRRFMVIGILGTRFAAWWYGLVARRRALRKSRESRSAVPEMRPGGTWRQVAN